MGTTSLAASAGWYFSCGADCSFFCACLVTVPLQAARTLGANTPSPRAAKATRRLSGGGVREVLTILKDTGRNDILPATTTRCRVLLHPNYRYSPQPSRTGSG